MTEEEYKRKIARKRFPEAHQLGEIDKNRGIINEVRKDRTIQKGIMIFAAVSAIAAALAAIFYFVVNFPIKGGEEKWPFDFAQDYGRVGTLPSCYEERVGQGRN